MPCRIFQHDEVYVYAYTGTWTADWPYTHFTQFLGKLLLQNKDKKQGVTKRCRISLLTNSALLYDSQSVGIRGVAGPQPMSTAVHIT